MWYNKYIDIPYRDGGRDASGLDCWGLVRLVYSDEFGIELPSFSDEYTTAKDHQKLSEIFAREREGWQQLDTAETGAVVLFRILGSEIHVGVYIGDGKFLHIREGVNSVIESVEAGKWKHRVVGYYKYSQASATNTLVALPHVLKTKPVTVPVIAGTNLQFLADWLTESEHIDPKIVARSVFMLNGKPLYQETWASTIVREGDTLEFRALAGDDQTFRLFAVIGLALVAPQLAVSMLGTVPGAYAAAFMGGTTTFLAVAQAGIMLVGSMLINAIAPIPEQPTIPSPTASEAQRFINGANNSIAQWGSIPVVLGKTRMTPPLGAYNNVRFSSDDSILNKGGNENSGGVAGSDTFVDMLLVWGYGPLVIDQATLRIGQVGFYNLDGNGNVTSQNYTNAKQITLDRISEPTQTLLSEFNAIYGRDVQQQFPNLALEYAGNPPVHDGGWSGPAPWTPKTRPTSATEGFAEYGFTQPSDYVSFSVHFPQGLRATIISGNGAGEERAATVGLELQYKINSGSWQPWPGSTQAGDAGHYSIGGKLAIATTSTTYEDWQYVFYGSDNSEYQLVTVTENTLQNTILTGTMVPNGFTWTVTLNRIDAQGVARWAPNDQITVRIRRTTGSDTEVSNYRYSHQAIVQSVTSTRNANPAVDPAGSKIAKTAITLQATDEINGQVDGINAIVQTYCKDWDAATQTWVLRGTSNPASLYRYVLQHPANPQPVEDSALDLASLQHWHEYCAQQRTLQYNNTNYQYTLEYNSVVAGQQRSVLSMLREIAAAGRASPSMTDGKWGVVIDEPKALVTQHFTPHNSWGFEATKMLPRAPEALKVQFNDRDSDYVQKEIIVAYTESEAATAQLLESISLPGVTSTAEAVSHAKWHLAQIKLRPEVYTINTDIEYIVCTRGDRVKLTHWVPQWGGGSGRVKNLFGNTVLELDELVNINPGVTNVLRVRNSSTGAGTEHTIVSTFALSAYEQSGTLVTVYTELNHPLSVGDTCTITSLNPLLNTTVGSVEEIVVAGGVPVGFSFTVATSTTTGITPVTGVLSLVSSPYKRVTLQTPSTIIAAGDLFIFGEYGTDSQDLLVTKIEPTSSKSARITMVDYGVTDSYNIFTDYSGNTITSATVFESQITQVPEFFNLVGDKKPLLDPTKFISDERVMRVIGPGVFEYAMKIPFENPAGLGNDVAYVLTEYYPANNPDASGAVTLRVPVTSGSVDFLNLVELEAYRFRLRYETKLGRLGPWTDWYVYGVIGKTNPPGPVTVMGTGYVELPSGLKITWNDNPEIDIMYYEVRTVDTGWGDEQHLFRGLTTELAVALTGTGVTDTWYVRAVDYANNYSATSTSISYTYPVVPNVSDLRETYSSSSLTEATVTVSWNPVTTSKFGVGAYQVDYDGVSVRVNSTSLTIPANWLGSQLFTVKTVDTLGSMSSGFSEAIDKFAPGPVSNFRVQVIDNNVLLYWNNPERTSLPIAHALIKRSGVGGTWETAEVVGTKSGEFTSFSELVAGEYVYYVAAVDTDNRESAYVQKAVNVAQPPDFVFYGEHNSTFAAQSNVAVTYSNASVSEGELVLPVNTTETFAQHFTGSSWTSPQDQVSAGYPYYIQPGLLTGTYTEEIDFQNVVPSSQLSLAVLATNLVGTCDYVVEMFTKQDAGDTYVATSGFATNFRFVKIVVTATQTVPGSILKVSSIDLKLSTKQITESAKLNVNSSAIVNFEREFIDVASVTLTASGTTPVNAVYDLKDTVRYCTYSTVTGVRTVTLPGGQQHGLVPGQVVRLYFTSGGDAGTSGRYLISTTPTSSSFTVAGGMATTGDVTMYPNSMVVYAFNSQTGAGVTAEISYLIRGY